MNDTHSGRAGAAYFTNVKLRGPILYHELECAIGVLESADGSRSIGVASPSGGNTDGLALWSLHVDGAHVPGLFTIVNGRFEPEPEV
jgi:hypothetical protein